MATSGKPDLLRRYNRDLIRELIQTKGPVTKIELARLSGASVPTVNKIVNQLETDGLICSLAGDSNNVGRKPVSYVINKDAGYFIVFFVQNEKIEGGLVNSFGEVLHAVSYAPDMASLETVNGLVFGSIDQLLTEIPKEKLRAIGLGVPGVIDPGNRIAAIPTVPCWEGIDLRSILEERYKVPVFLENDVKLMTVGIYKDEFEEKCRNMVLLYVSEGLGAGIVINGRLYKGNNNFAGEYGFMMPDFEASMIHPEFTGDLEFKLHPLAVKKLRNEPLGNAEKGLFVNILSGIVTNFISVLDPDVILICSPNLTEEELGLIRERTLSRIPDYCMPELRITDGNGYGIRGTVEMCMTGIDSRISLVDETGI